MQPIDIMSLAEPAIPERQSKLGTVLYSSSGFLKKPVEQFNRNEKLAFIESRFSLVGHAADAEKSIVEIRCSRLSRA